MDDNELEFEKARKEAEAALNELRKIHGEKPIYELQENIKENPYPPLCSFCGKGKNQVKRMIKGNGVYICNECILLCLDLISE